MDVDAMDELMYDTLIRYFKTLAHTGYKSYDVVFKMLVMDFIYEITHTELRYYITNKDIKLMQDLLYQLFGSTCEISFPTNNRPCCVCVCCNREGTTPPPVVVPTTTTTSTKPPVGPTYLILSSTVANTAYVDYELVEMWTPIKVEVGSKVTIMAQSVSGYTFKGFYVAGSLISNSNTLQYTIPSTGTNTIELRYEEEEESTTTTTTTTSSTTTTSTTTSTQPPVKTLTVVFKHDPKTAYTITYNGSNRLTVSDLEDGKIKLNFPADVNSLQFIINSIVCANSNYECNEVRQGMLSHSLPYSISVAANQYITITPVIADSEPTTTTTSTTSTTSTQPPGQLAYLQLDTKDLDMSLPEDSRTVNVKVSNGGGSNSFVLNGDTIHHSYSGLGGTIGSKVTLSLPLSTYEQVVGFYDSKTGELLSNGQEYKFDTPSDGMSYITIKFKGSDSTNL